MGNQVKVNFNITMTEAEFSAYQGSTDVLLADTIISIQGTDDKFMATGNAGEVIPLFTSRLKNVSNGKFENTNYNVEYESNNERDKVYGQVYKVYFTTTLPSILTNLGNITKLVDFNIQGNNAGYEYQGRGWSTDGISYMDIKRVIATSNLVLSVNGFTDISGWVEYTK